ncbi:MAG: FtsW/RodA/SpoVE family cell cycle protein [Tidjanibacter sp.]|nr:FtsW/RodA/SpoVE family cell cycle protein [Tidjanibacter sp.]
MAGSKDSGQNSLMGRIFAGDKVMWVALVILLIYSLFVVYSTTAYDLSVSASQELIRQILFICIGMTGFYIAQSCSIKFYKAVTVPFLLLALTLTLIMIFAHQGSGAERSLKILGIDFQPFEFLKFAIIINLAKQLSTRQKQMDSLSIIPSFRISDWKEDSEKQLNILYKQTLPILGPIALCCILTVKFSNSTTLIIATSSLAMMFLSRVNKNDLGKIILLGMLVGGLALAIYGKEGSRSGTAVSRISSWSPIVLNKSVGVGSDGKEYYKRGENEHDQTLYAKMSIATGGLVGKGAGQSTNRYLAEADKDMAYAFLIEEFGLLGGGLVMLFIFLVIFYRSIVIFQKCGMAFPGLLVLGIGTVIVLQAFLHMLVSVSLFPLTGQQLPIVSKGGTSLVLSLTMLGVLMGVSAKVEES